MSENSIQPVLSDETRALGVQVFMKKDGQTKEQAEASVAAVEAELENEEGLFLVLGRSREELQEFIDGENTSLTADAHAEGVA